MSASTTVDNDYTLDITRSARTQYSSSGLSFYMARALYDMKAREHLDVSAFASGFLCMTPIAMASIIPQMTMEACQSAGRVSIYATAAYEGSRVPAPGEAITQDIVERNKRFRAALSLISDFERDGFSWSNSSPRKISPETALAAKNLLRSLGAGADLPKLAPDSEGTLAMVWERGNASVLILVDGDVLHLARNAATPQATYLDNLPFDGYEIPEEIKNALG
jgi:hypothetical protein